MSFFQVHVSSPYRITRDNLLGWNLNESIVQQLMIAYRLRVDLYFQLPPLKSIGISAKVFALC